MITISFYDIFGAAILFGAIIMLIVGAICFSLGKLFQEQANLQKAAHMSFVASLYALAEAKSFKSSTVLQRIVEVYKAKGAKRQPLEDDFTGEFNDFMDEALGLGAQLKKKRESTKWKEGEVDSGDEIYDPEKDPEYDRARSLV